MGEVWESVGGSVGSEKVLEEVWEKVLKCG